MLDGSVPAAYLSPRLKDGYTVMFIIICRSGACVRLLYVARLKLRIKLLLFSVVFMSNSHTVLLPNCRSRTVENAA